MRKMTIAATLLALVGCAGGAERAAMMPTPILCRTMEELSPAYIRYDEYLAELSHRGADCAEYVGATTTVRVR